jgi:hypothetical protein
MEASSWQAFYTSDLQQVYALLVAPALLLAFFVMSKSVQGASFRDARFLRLYVVAFCVETLLDPIATGPITRALGLAEAASSGTMLVFVLLGDFRVFLLVSHLTRPERKLGFAAREAALWTLIVPLFAGVTRGGLGLVIADLPSQVLWLIYEVAFLVVALVLRNRVVPRRLRGQEGSPRRELRRVTSYVAAYYALWATADALILFGGIDAGWLLRVVPNQLYYAFYLPWVAFVFFRRA